MDIFLTTSFTSHFTDRLLARSPAMTTADMGRNLRYMYLLFLVVSTSAAALFAVFIQYR